ncbi:MAG: metal ABC transporter permease [Chloroflexi bacterium]|nr:metal ABC transporter permease [Chloroflexota bacterium]
MWEQLLNGWAALNYNYELLILRPLEIPLLARSLEAAILVGIVSGVVGTYVVVRGMAFFGDALAHSILPGVAFMYQRTNGRTDELFWGGLFAGIFSALGISILARYEKIREDTAIGVVFAAMFALGITMISRIRDYTGDLTHILFGQTIGVSEDDLKLTLAFSVIVLVLVALFYKEFMIISFDRTLARTLRLPGELFDILLLVLIAVTIVVSLQTVGVALMAALLVTPAATANLITRRLFPMMLVSALLGAASSIIGFYISYLRDTPAGPSMVLTATALFGFVLVEQQAGRSASNMYWNVHARWTVWQSTRRADSAPLAAASER